MLQVPRDGLKEAFTDIELATCEFDNNSFDESIDKWVEAIKKWLEDEEGREKIAYAAHSRVISTHLYTHRMYEVVDRLKEEGVL